MSRTAGWRYGCERLVASISMVFASVGALATAADPVDLHTISVELRLRTGGRLSGAVLEHNDHGLAILSGVTPHVFAWSELEGGSAFAARRNLLMLERGGSERLTAEDHFALGAFSLRYGRNDLAANEFEQARKMNPDLALRIREAFDEFRRQTEAVKKVRSLTQPYAGPLESESPPAGDGERPTLERAAFEALATNGAAGPPAEVRPRVREAYLRFANIVRERMGEDISLVESDHFLIWTDWEKGERSRLADWCEGMYAALANRFGLDPKADIFLAKCPVFCFRSKARFKAFARDFDGYDARDALGYTRSIERNGHVHMVFARIGREPADYDRFACTLVHEGTHAFLHRLGGHGLIPHWVNEGFADLTAQRVLGDRCPHAGNADLLARQYARFDWPIAPLIESNSTLAVHQYPLAHALVAYLEGLDGERFIRFVSDLKGGASAADSLAGNYDGLTFKDLEIAWKAAVRDMAGFPARTADGARAGSD